MPGRIWADSNQYGGTRGIGSQQRFMVATQQSSVDQLLTKRLSNLAYFSGVHEYDTPWLRFLEQWDRRHIRAKTTWCLNRLGTHARVVAWSEMCISVCIRGD